MIKQVGGASHPATELANEIALARPVATQCSTEPVVPFRPARWETADPITIRPKVPRLGDQFDAGQNRILPDGCKERAAAIEAIGAAAERGREIEPETVDVTDLHPITQRVHHHLQHARMGEVEGISAARTVGVVARLVRQQPII